jgi:hypothetical protein
VPRSGASSSRLFLCAHAIKRRKNMKALLRSCAAICALLLIPVSPTLGQPGSIDTTFNIGTGENSPSTYCLAIQTNGQIVIGGAFFNSFNGFACTGIARLNTNGSVDTTFDPGGGVSGEVNCMAIQPDRSIVVGGGFRSINGLTPASTRLLSTCLWKLWRCNLTEKCWLEVIPL